MRAHLGSLHLLCSLADRRKLRLHCTCPYPSRCRRPCRTLRTPDRSTLLGSCKCRHLACTGPCPNRYRPPCRTSRRWAHRSCPGKRTQHAHPPAAAAGDPYELLSSGQIAGRTSQLLLMFGRLPAPSRAAGSTPGSCRRSPYAPHRRAPAHDYTPLGAC